MKKIRVRRKRAEDLFDLSLTQEGAPYTDIIVKKPEYRNLVTFSQNKKEPIYNWFYYKEGFSRELIWNLFDEFNVKKDKEEKRKDLWILDPFCGTGNSLLASKQFGVNALGFDILPLGVFISNTKLQDDYDLELLYEKIREITSLKFGSSSLKWPDVGFLDIKKAFSRYARNDLLFFKEKIFEVENEKIRNFLFLGLLSVVGEVSNTKKDGGVLRIVKKKHLPPVRYLLKNRLKRMYKDLKRVNPRSNEGITAKAMIGDARSLTPSKIKERFDFCITSPPYLNFVDYTKLYGLELALLVDNSKEILEIRKKSIRSFVGGECISKHNVKSEILDKTLERVQKFPKVIEGYFQDMQSSLSSIYNIMKNDSKIAIIIGNTSLPEITIDCDLILAEISEHIGFKVKEIWVVNVRWATIHGIKKEKPVRESILILEKEKK
jgi:DNA modification methylase